MGQDYEGDPEEDPYTCYSLWGLPLQSAVVSIRNTKEEGKYCMILSSFKYMLTGPTLLALLTVTKISRDCYDAGSGPKTLHCGQFQKAIWENSVSFHYTSYCRRISITKDHKQSCTELTVWSKQNVGEYCADPYFLESQKLDTENFLAEWLKGLKRWLTGFWETRWWIWPPCWSLRTLSYRILTHAHSCITESIYYHLCPQP